jgi:hypothetical protein
VLDDSFDVGHGGHPFKLSRRLSAVHVFKVDDSRTNVKKKMRKSCVQGSKRRNSPKLPTLLFALRTEICTSNRSALAVQR